MKVVTYLRVSTEDQGRSGLGLEAQQEACSRYVEKADIDSSVESFSDVGISGACGLDKRPGLIEAIGALSKGDIFIVAKRDRLGRDPIVCATIERAITRKGARIISAAGEGTDGDEPSDILMRRVIDAFSEHERLIIGARTRAALQAKRHRQEKTGGALPPFGFDVDLDGKLIRNETEQRAIKKIMDLRKKGYSIRAICGNLEEKGYLTKSGSSTWNPKTVSMILKRAA